MPNTIYQKPYRAVIEWLKSARRDGGQSMRAIAETLTVPHTWVAKVEAGERRLDLLEYVRFCGVLGLDPAVGLRMVIEQLGPAAKKTGSSAKRAPGRKPSSAQKSK